MRTRYLQQWADLLRRVFAQDGLACSCGGRHTVTAFVVNTTRARRVAAKLMLPFTKAVYDGMHGGTEAALGEGVSKGLVGFTVLILPGLAGWELKEKS
jgi:hypothetical protein